MEAKIKALECQCTVQIIKHWKNTVKESCGFPSPGSSRHFNQKPVRKGLNIGDPAYIISQTISIPILPFKKKTVKNLSDSENAVPYSHTVLPSANR